MADQQDLSVAKTRSTCRTDRSWLARCGNWVGNFRRQLADWTVLFNSRLSIDAVLGNELFDLRNCVRDPQRESVCGLKSGRVKANLPTRLLTPLGANSSGGGGRPGAAGTSRSLSWTVWSRPVGDSVCPCRARREYGLDESSGRNPASADANVPRSEE